MAERFTGFWERTGSGHDGELATTVTAVPTETLLAVLRARLDSAEPGDVIRIDLIAWEAPE